MNGTVLIVDDDEQVLELVSDVLERSDLDLQIETTASGYDACVHFGECEPDLVVLDLHMPGVDGAQALTSMRNASRRGARFLAVSGDPSRFEAMLKRGCDACLAKPFHNSDLIDQVATLLQLVPAPTNESTRTLTGVATEG